MNIDIILKVFVKSLRLSAHNQNHILGAQASFVENSGGVRPPSPPRHDITALEEPFHARGLIFFLYYELFDPHVFKRVLAYFPLPFRLSGGYFPFQDPIREALLLCEAFYFYEHV